MNTWSLESSAPVTYNCHAWWREQEGPAAAAREWHMRARRRKATQMGSTNTELAVCESEALGALTADELWGVQSCKGCAARGVNARLEAQHTRH